MGQVDYNRLQVRTEGVFNRLAQRLATGKITTDAWEKRMYLHLIERHARAAHLGRERAGESPVNAREAKLLGEVVANSEGRFLHRFADDIREGRYTGDDGSLSEKQIAQRARYYAARLLGTANEAFVEASDPESVYTWTLGGAEEHCEDCPEMAAGSPYTSATLWTYPRSGQTQCLFHCKCHLARGDGQASFRPPT